MSETDFTTHLYKKFTEKYGDMLQSFFINDALVGKYLSAGELYHYLYPTAHDENMDERGKDEGEFFLRYSPQFPTFEKNYRWITNFVNKLLIAEKPYRHTLDNFFIGNFKEVGFPKDSEGAYWENLFANAWITSQGQDSKIICNRKYFDSDKEAIVEAIEDIVLDGTWFKLNLWHSVLWSIELFRLRFLLDNMIDNQFDFVYVLDWIDIFEYRIVPKVLVKVNENLTKKNENGGGLQIYNYFIKKISKATECLYATRYGLDESQRRKVWRIRKAMLPIKDRFSDVNIIEDKEIYADLVSLLKKKAGKNNQSLEVCKHIKTIVAERNKYRDIYMSNGGSYMALNSTERLEHIDAEFIDISLNLFKELTTEKNIGDSKSIIANLLIYHMIHAELIQQGNEDLVHPSCEQQKEELQQRYVIYRRDILIEVFQSYTDNKRLHMDVILKDIRDDLLAEMIIAGSGYLSKNTSDSMLSKIFQNNSSAMDEERNGFINKTWSSFEVEDKALYSIFVGRKGKLERIRGYIMDEKKLSSEERQYIDQVSENWEKEIVSIHELLKFRD